MPQSTRSMVSAGCIAAALLLSSAGLVRLADAQAKSPRLDVVLRQMDAASVKFQSAQANIRKQVFTKIVNDTEEQTGSIFFLRKGGSTQMSMKLTSPPTTVEYKDGKVRLYNPGTNHLDELTAAGANKTRFETFLTLGFGASGTDLQKAWIIEDQGPESISDGDKTVATEKLDLISKDVESRNTVAHVTIWVDPTRAVSMKQILYFPKGDTQTAFYTNIRLNESIDLQAFAIKCKGKCN